jgi:heme-degrading monooxygenase HmoA
METNKMILEVAILNIRAGQAQEFEVTFKQASSIISSMPGYISHELQKCIENPDRYILLAYWETLEAHTVGFRGSAEYQDWKKLLHHFYDPFPTVEHFEKVFGSSATS